MSRAAESAPDAHRAASSRLRLGATRRTTRRSHVNINTRGHDARKNPPGVSVYRGRDHVGDGLRGTAFAQAVGTWKLNLEKSKYQEGQALKSTTLVYEAAGEGIKVTVDQAPAVGAAIHYAYTANYDGKDVPVVGNPNADMAARTRVNATTTKLVNKKDGNVLSTVTSCCLRRWEDVEYHDHRQGRQRAEHR